MLSPNPTWIIFLVVPSLVFPQIADDTKKREEYKYRLMNWCIVGQGEQPLYQWPLTQLKPYLLDSDNKPREFSENDKDRIKNISEPKLTLEFEKIKCDNPVVTKYVGDKDGDFVNRAHIIFKSDVYIQGLVIQANHAPFGLGFPFGQFDLHDEYSCIDCKHDFSRIIGCISRPDVSLMHPTVGAFHHMLNNKKWIFDLADPEDITKPKTKDSVETDELVPVKAQKEIHFNFKWAHTQCSSSKIVEFWALIVIDFDHSIWMVKKFGPYDFFDDIQIISSGSIPQPFLPSPILPGCNPFPPMLYEILPNGTEVTTAAPCVPTDTTPCPLVVTGGPTQETPKPLARSCYIEGLYYNATRCALWKENKRQNFTKHLTDRPPTAHLMPDIFKSKIMCESKKPYFTSNNDKSKVWSQIRFAGDFDTSCVTFYNRPRDKEKMVFQRPHKLCDTWQGRFYCSGDTNDLAFNNPWLNNVIDTKRSFPRSKCEPCVVITTKAPPEENQGKPFFKRGAHGGIMAFAFFFCLPVSITIPRFYKETLHSRDVKGWRIWLVIHVGLSTLVVFMSYISYTLPSFKTLDGHMYLGYAALICCVGGLGSGWLRHKDDCLNKISIYIHALSGYAGWGLAIGSMVLAPGIGNAARILCYFASGISLGAMAILTIHICMVDHKMGLIPSRSHIPIIEIKFDDIFPPGHKFRKFFLIGYAVIQFLVCCGMLTF